MNAGDISGATNASPIVLTVPAWATMPAVGQIVVVKGVNGNTAANGTFSVQAVTATTLTLQGSTGNGAFAASPGSTVTAIGPQKIRILNVGTAPITLTHDDVRSSAFARFLLPPAYVNVAAGIDSVTFQQFDSITLWWDYCTATAWKVISCTVDSDSGGVTGTYYATQATSNTTLNNSTYTSVLSLSIATAGTYLITADLCAEAVMGTGGGIVSVSGKLQLNGTDITNSSIAVFATSVPATDQILDSVTGTMIVTVPASSTVTLLAVGAGTPPGISWSAIGNAALGGFGATKLTAVRIA